MSAKKASDCQMPLFSECIVLFLCVVIGTFLQVVLWKTPDNTYLYALIRHGYLWIVYILFALMLAERMGRILTLPLWFIIGSVLQILLWKTPENTYEQALVRHGYLWVVYLVVAFLLAEYIWRRRLKGAKPDVVGQEPHKEPAWVGAMTPQEVDQMCLATTKEILAEFAERFEQVGIAAGEPRVAVASSDEANYESEIMFYLFTREDQSIYTAVELHSVLNGKPFTTQEERREYLRSEFSHICSLRD